MRRDLHADYGAEFETRGGHTVVSHYGRPERTHLAVRNSVGIIEMGYGVVVVEGDDAVEYVDDAVSNSVPDADGRGCYALLLDPQGHIRTDLYVYNAGERLLCFTPPDRAESLAVDWRETVFVRDVTVRDASREFAVFGVHGPAGTDAVTAQLSGADAPETPLTFVRGSIADVGVTVVKTDDPTGERGYEVVTAAAEADTVLDSLLTRGTPTTPVGYRTWDTLTLEAGTPLFETELAGRIPNVAGVHNALDFDKGCYLGQEVVSRVANRGRPSRRLVGLGLGAVPDPGAAVVDRRASAGDADADAVVGEVTRAAEAPSCGRPVGLAYVASDTLDDPVDALDLAVRVDGGTVDATITPLPFVEGSGRSARLPRYDSD